MDNVAGQKKAMRLGDAGLGLPQPQLGPKPVFMSRSIGAVHVDLEMKIRELKQRDAVAIYGVEVSFPRAWQSSNHRIVTDNHHEDYSWFRAGMAPHSGLRSECGLRLAGVGYLRPERPSGL